MLFAVLAFAAGVFATKMGWMNWTDKAVAWLKSKLWNPTTPPTTNPPAA